MYWLVVNSLLEVDRGERSFSAITITQNSVAENMCERQKSNERIRIKIGVECHYSLHFARFLSSRWTNSFVKVGLHHFNYCTSAWSPNRKSCCGSFAARTINKQRIFYKREERKKAANCGQGR
ncbi:hypothetical protein DINM_005271 [Dirofilaria immitis]|nr:hypothetical protein [Dirofilaria immitis]